MDPTARKTFQLPSGSFFNTASKGATNLLRLATGESTYEAV